MLPEPDWERIRTLAQRAEEIQLAGRMDRDTWRQLLSDALEAAKGNPDFTSFLAPYATAEWLQELREEDRAGHRSVA